MMKLVLKTFFPVMLWCAMAGPVAGRQPGMKGWILLDYDMPYLRKMITIAPRYSIDHIQLSHHICMFAEEVLEDDQRAADLRELIDLCHAHGLQAFIWSHEIARLPAELRQQPKIDLDGPQLYDWIREKYRRLFAALPGLDGIVMTYSETHVSIFNDGAVTSEMTHAERITRLTNAINDVCQASGKRLIVRDWANVGTGSWDELLEFEEGLKNSAPEVIIMTKHTAGDWYLLADNPLMGTVGDHDQLCEFDLAGEHHGKQILPWCCPEYIKQRWQWALANGADGAAGRTERYDRHILGSPGEVNLAAFSAALDDPEVDMDRVWHDWAAAEFGAESADAVVRALKRTDAIVLKTFYARRAYWGSDHSRVPAFDYLAGHLRGKTAVPFDPSFEPIEADLLNPDAQTLEWVLAEKDEALALVDQSLADLESARLTLKERDYLYLRDYLLKAGALVRFFRGINEVYFTVVLAEKQQGQARAAWLERYELARDRLQAAADAIFAHWGTDFVLGHSSEERNHLGLRTRRFLKQAQSRVEALKAP